ncbi:MAG: sigma-70 family RNA polymerase sigma factor, partial [Isosphaeraceae bacterium]|nr:sigma-70 family RNA polymerase sigma factor [Isosphaeraceae bacterium]
VVGLGEGALLERFVTRRDEAAFAALVGRYGPTVLGVCRARLDDPHDVEDAFQATFLVLARKAGSIRQPELLGPWLYGVALRTARRARLVAARRRARESSGIVMEAEEMAVGPVEESDLERRERLDALHAELERLPA